MAYQGGPFAQRASAGSSTSSAARPSSSRPRQQQQYAQPGYGSNSGNSTHTYSIPVDDLDDENYFSLIWGGEKMRIPLPEPDAPLSALRAAIEERTGVAPQHQKLIVGGAALQKDLPLKTYGLVKASLRDTLYGNNKKEENDDKFMPSMGMRNLLSKWGLGNTPAAGKKNTELKITMIASKDASAVVRDRGDAADDTGAQGRNGDEDVAIPASRQQQQAAQHHSKTAATQESLDEPRIVEKIQTLVKNTFDKLQPSIDTVLQPQAGETAKEVHKTYLMVSEILLQTLMKLDGFEIESQWTEARKARKEGIRKVQELLDKVDAAKESRQSNGGPKQIPIN